MLLGDLLNADFDIDCNVEVYKVNSETSWGESGSKLIYTTHKYMQLPDAKYLDMKVKYMIVNNNTLIIEIDEEE